MSHSYSPDTIQLKNDINEVFLRNFFNWTLRQFLLVFLYIKSSILSSRLVNPEKIFPPMISITVYGALMVFSVSFFQAECCILCFLLNDQPSIFRACLFHSFLFCVIHLVASCVTILYSVFSLIVLTSIVFLEFLLFQRHRLVQIKWNS